MAGAEAHPFAPTASQVTVSVVLSLAPRRVQEAVLVLPRGATLAEAVAHAVQLLPDAQQAALLVWSVWGRQVPASHRLQEGDRVEGTRALRVDPKVARRERFARQGARATGLFSKRQQRRVPAASAVVEVVEGADAGGQRGQSLDRMP